MFHMSNSELGRWTKFHCHNTLLLKRCLCKRMRSFRFEDLPGILGSRKYSDFFTGTGNNLAVLSEQELYLL